MLTPDVSPSAEPASALPPDLEAAHDAVLACLRAHYTFFLSLVPSSRREHHSAIFRALCEATRRARDALATYGGPSIEFTVGRGSNDPARIGQGIGCNAHLAAINYAIRTQRDAAAEGGFFLSDAFALDDTEQECNWLAVASYFKARLAPHGFHVFKAECDEKWNGWAEQLRIELFRAAALRSAPRLPIGGSSDFVPTSEDITILYALDQAKRAMTGAQVAQQVNRIYKERGGLGDREAWLTLVGERKVGERAPLLEKHGLVSRPTNKDGRLSLRKGIGITSAGCETLKRLTVARTKPAT